MTRIPDHLRRLSIERAHYCCEYCRISLEDRLYLLEVDHIIPEKHRGETTEENLCLSCMRCNRHKGSDFASFDPESNEITLLYNPRQNKWDEHFRLDGARIVPLTPQGRVTVFVLGLNNHDCILEREALLDVDHYPCADE